MALSSTDIKRTVFGNKRVVLASLTFDDSYPTGGEAITPALFGLSSIDYIAPQPHASRFFVWDGANSKLLVYTALGTQATDLSDQSTIVAQITVYGN